LEGAGLITKKRNGRENTIAFSPQPLKAVARYVMQYEQFWNEKLDRLETYFAKKGTPK
jgi:predicted MarR family transcription regulator